jgi:hypothetical protein
VPCNDRPVTGDHGTSSWKAVSGPLNGSPQNRRNRTDGQTTFD